MTSLLRCAPNFRDLGGTPALAGRPLKHGLLFRAETFHAPTAEDQSWLKQGKIGLVVDLRSDLERLEQAGYWLSQNEVPVRHMPKMTDVRAAAGTEWVSRLAEMDLQSAMQKLRENYALMPAAFRNTLTEIFRLLDSPESPSLLIHCVMGKDRTGFAVAMVLAALGADRDVILKDYLTTSERLPPRQVASAKIQELKAQGSPLPLPEVLEALSGTQPEWLSAAFDAAARDYGSLEDYLAACGADGARRARLQSRMLTTL